MEKQDLKSLLENIYHLLAEESCDGGDCGPEVLDYPWVPGYDERSPEPWPWPLHGEPIPPEGWDPGPNYRPIPRPTPAPGWPKNPPFGWPSAVDPKTGRPLWPWPPRGPDLAPWGTHRGGYHVPVMVPQPWNPANPWPNSFPKVPPPGMTPGGSGSFFGGQGNWWWIAPNGVLYHWNPETGSWGGGFYPPPKEY